MDEYTLDMDIKFNPDKTSIDALDKIAENFKQSFKLTNEDFESLRNVFNEFEQKRQSIIEAGKMLQTYRTAKDLPADEDDEYTSQLQEYIRTLSENNEALKELASKYSEQSDEEQEDDSSDDSTKDLQKKFDNFVGKLKRQVVDKLSSIANSFISGIANVFNDAWAELGNIVDQSFLTNNTYRTNAFSYGMSASESYGFEQAKSMLGVTSEEDLWYMNEYQQEKFRDIMTKYAERYESLYDSGFFEDYLDYQIEMREFQQDVQLEIVEFFMDNKDTIKEFMNVGIESMQYIVDALAWIMDAINPNDATSNEEKIDNVNSILEQYVSNNSSVTNNTVNMDGTYTFNGTTDSQKSYYVDMLKSSMVEAKKAFLSE